MENPSFQRCIPFLLMVIFYCQCEGSCWEPLQLLHQQGEGLATLRAETTLALSNPTMEATSWREKFPGKQIRGHDVIPVDFSRSFLVPLIGGRDHIMTQLAIYTTYIPLRNNHWLMVQKSGVHPLIWKFLPLFTRFPLYVRWFSRWISPSTVFPTQTKCTLFKKAINSLFKITTTFASKNLIPSKMGGIEWPQRKKSKQPKKEQQTRCFFDFFVPWFVETGLPHKQRADLKGPNHKQRPWPFWVSPMTTLATNVSLSSTLPHWWGLKLPI